MLNNHGRKKTQGILTATQKVIPPSELSKVTGRGSGVLGWEEGRNSNGELRGVWGRLLFPDSFCPCRKCGKTVMGSPRPTDSEDDKNDEDNKDKEVIVPPLAAYILKLERY